MSIAVLPPASPLRLAPARLARRTRLARLAVPVRRWSQVAVVRRLGERAGWLSGLLVNLVLAGAYLLIDPLTAESHRPWAIVVGSYLVVFLLADGVTTNVLGVDARRVGRSLAAGTSLRRILLARNGTVGLVAGLPILAITAAVTLTAESAADLAVTLPGVTLSLALWFGIGNVISVLHPVATVPMRERWEQRHRPQSLVRWLVAVALPWILCLGSDPICELLVRTLHRAGLLQFGDELSSSLSLSGLAVLIYLAGTAAALAVARRRGLPQFC